MASFFSSVGKGGEIMKAIEADRARRAKEAEQPGGTVDRRSAVASLQQQGTAPAGEFRVGPPGTGVGSRGFSEDQILNAQVAQEGRRASNLEQAALDDVARQFAQARSLARGQEKRSRQQLGDIVNRQKAITGLKGGVITKAAEKGLRAIGEQAGETQTQLASAESGVLANLRSQAAQRAAGREAQIRGSRENLLTRLQDERQFSSTLEFQRDVFNKEFDQNLKTLLLNSVIALDESGIDNKEDFNRVVNGLRNLFRSEV